MKVVRETMQLDAIAESHRRRAEEANKRHSGSVSTAELATPFTLFRIKSSEGVNTLVSVYSVYVYSVYVYSVYVYSVFGCPSKF